MNYQFTHKNTDTLRVAYIKQPIPLNFYSKSNKNTNFWIFGNQFVKEKPCFVFRCRWTMWFRKSQFFVLEKRNNLWSYSGDEANYIFLSRSGKYTNFFVSFSENCPNLQLLTFIKKVTALPCLLIFQTFTIWKLQIL